MVKKTQLEIGSVYGRLTVIGPAERRYYYKCRCLCGNAKNIYYFSLKSGDTTSCGCYQKVIAREVNTKHGKTYSKVYLAWRNIWDRCENPKCIMYHAYGGRGITVCRRWEKFENFLADMGDPPSLKHSIDRVDNDGDYAPGNCRWASRAEQACNTSRNVKITWRGRTMILKDWAKELGVGDLL